MIKFKKIFFLLALPFLLSQVFSLGKKDQEESKDSSKKTETEIKKDFLKTDIYINSKNEDKKNHFYWVNSTSSEKDSFDAISGASRGHSTKKLREFTFDKNTKEFQIPKGLYCLSLYGVANPDLIKKDNFLVTQDGKKLTITFSHRGNDYLIQSDEKGIISVPESFSYKPMKKISEAEPENKTSEKENEEVKAPEEGVPREKAGEEPKSEGQSPEEQSQEAKEAEESLFISDGSSEKLNYIYKGNLNSTFSPEGVLKIWGKLKLTDISKKEEIKDKEKIKEEGKEGPSEEPEENQEKKSENSKEESVENKGPEENKKA
ncbi:MAG: hypothetical protein K5873_11160 [Treponema sp.]|nr:hypothetical protein [Treponema sp.]